MTLNWGYLLERYCFLLRSLLSFALKPLRGSFIPFSIGHDHSLHDVWNRWPILRIGRWELVIRAVRRFCYSSSWQHSAFGTGRLARYRSTPLTRQKWKFFIGRGSHFADLGHRSCDWMADSTGLDTKAERSYSCRTGSGPAPIIGRRYRG